MQYFVKYKTNEQVHWERENMDARVGDLFYLTCVNKYEFLIHYEVTSTSYQEFIQLATDFSALGKKIIWSEDLSEEWISCFKMAIKLFEKVLDSNLIWDSIKKIDLYLNSINNILSIYKIESLMTSNNLLEIDTQKINACLNDILISVTDLPQQRRAYICYERLGKLILERGNSCFQFNGSENMKRYLTQSNPSPKPSPGLPSEPPSEQRCITDFFRIDGKRKAGDNHEKSSKRQCTRNHCDAKNNSYNSKFGK